MEQKKILHVIKGLGRGGAERLLISTIRQHHKDYHFDVVYFLSDKSHLKPELELLGCSVTCVKADNIMLMLLKIPALITLVKSNSYNLIHAHLPWAGIVARVVGKVTRIPVVYTEHNVFNRYNIITRLGSRLTYSWQKKVIAVSDRVAEALRAELKSIVPVQVIANGVDVEEFTKEKSDRYAPQVSARDTNDQQPGWLGFPKNSLIVGMVGALTSQKRVDRWIQIAMEVERSQPNVCFVIVGDGVLRQELERQARPLKDQVRLRFAGLTSRPAEWLSRFDIFLMSSDFEGLPVALLEAMSMKCACVATRVGGIPAVIKHGHNGYLYEPEQWLEAVNIINTLANDPQLLRQTGENARKTVVDHFSVVRMVTELEQVYHEVLTNQA